MTRKSMLAIGIVSVSLVVLGAIGIVMALGIRQIETRLLRWRPEYQKR